MLPTTSIIISVLAVAILRGNVALADPAPAPGSLPTLAFRTNFNVTGFTNLLAADQARAAAFVKYGRERENLGTPGKRAAVSSITATNTAVSYTSQIGIGSPATSYTLLIDTGSSNTWVGAGKRYVQTSTSRNTGQRVSVSYGSGSFSGTEYTDTVTISPSLVIPGQSIGVASSASGFSGIDGILGVGPVDLTAGTLVGSTATIPTVTDNLFSQGTIPANQIGVFFAPTTTRSSANGELTFGGVDSTKISGAVAYVPVTTTSPANQFFGIQQSLNYGTTSLFRSLSGIVDTGTTLCLIATDAFNIYKNTIGAQPDANTGLLSITAAQYQSLRNLDFVIGGTTRTLTPNAQIWPRALNTYIGGTANGIYLIVADLGTPSGQGLDFVNGYTFLERYYSVYDTANKRVGFAATAFTNATSN
ncbi:hypothetical protein PLICRDRAFT_48185 [Plicaturopsis crispa FD-325 SS-3]|nr:hypothetical protein PLICRDRAFT_48185 [Plicaturopsis crispa FD-325 SS-3]